MISLEIDKFFLASNSYRSGQQLQISDGHHEGHHDTQHNDTQHKNIHHVSFNRRGLFLVQINM